LISESVFVTSIIFALIMPPTIPWHISAIGVSFAVIISKQLFGGFGKNIFNPAMAGRCFIYICFPVAMTATWAPAAQEKIGALNKWSTYSHIDSISSATPMANLKAGYIKLVRDAKIKNEIPFNLKNNQEPVYISSRDFYIAELTGRLPGTMGVTSVIAILIGGLYLLFSKTASPQIIISTILSYFLSTHIFYLFGINPLPDGFTAVMGGGFLFGAFFMATDPVSAPKTNEAKIIYGIIIGLFTMIIRNFSIFNGGLMFAILIGNMFAPTLDYTVNELKSAIKNNENK